MSCTITFPNGIYVRNPGGKVKEYKINSRENQQKAVRKMMKHAFHFIKDGVDFPIEVVFPFTVKCEDDKLPYPLEFDIKCQEELRFWVSNILSVSHELKTGFDGHDKNTAEADLLSLGL